MGYRLYWTKMALGWDAERRYRVYDLDEQAHSGASILALADVLHALDKFETGDDNT
jgi:hypothetical protein